MENWDAACIQLLSDLKMIFPEVPEEKIYECIVRNSKNKEECIKFLTRVKEDYLFGCQLPIAAQSIRDKFNKLGLGENTEHLDSKESFESELDIYIPEETLHFTFLMNEEKKGLNLKENSQSILQETDVTDNILKKQSALGKSTVHSAPVMSSASPFGLMDNGNVLSTNVQTEPSSSTDTAHLLTKNNSISKQILKWNNSCNDLAVQLQPSAQFHRQNFLRGYSYPDPLAINLQNIPYPSLSQSPFCNYNNLKSKDFTTPLYVVVTSPQFLTPYSHSSVGLLSSPNVQRRHSPIPSHLTPSYPSPLSAVLPTSLPSSVSDIPAFPYSSIHSPHQQQSSTNNLSRNPTSVTSSRHYAYEHTEDPVIDDQLRERIGIMKASQSTTISFQPPYELFPKQDFIPETCSSNFTTSLNQYSSQFAHQMSPFLSKGSHTKPEGNNEVDYVKALLPYQMNNYQLIMEELQKMRNLRYTLRMDVSSREQALSQIRQQQKFPNMEQIQKLREEIIKLRVERDCLTMELDFHVKGQESTNTIEESFYENIFTGPKGPIPPAPNNRTASVQDSYAEHRDDDDQRNKWNCSKCTYANHPDLIDCEICESPRVMIMLD